MDEQKEKSKYNLFAELGLTGLRHNGGWLCEDFLTELQGQKAIKIYKEMADNDDIIGSFLFAIEMLIRQVDFNVEPAGKEQADIDCAEFIESCLNDMTISWQDTISEILSFLTFGYSVHEIVYKRRLGVSKNKNSQSKYNDGLIGWKRLPIRSQDSIWRWDYDKENDLQGVYQMPPPDYVTRYIPIEKTLLFTTKSKKESPEGRSILRNAYRSYYFKRRFQEIEGVGVERNLSGYPKITLPDTYDFSDENNKEAQAALTVATTLVQNVRQDEKAGIVLPSGWEFELISASGSKSGVNVSEIIERYDKRMAQTVLADFIFLGTSSQTGSFALADNKTKLFSVAISSFLKTICGTFNTQAIPRLIDLNKASFEGITDYPRLTHGDIEELDVEKIANAVEKFTNVGLFIPQEGDENRVRQAINFPEKIIDGDEVL